MRSNGTSLFNVSDCCTVNVILFFSSVCSVRLPLLCLTSVSHTHKHTDMHKHTHTHTQRERARECNVSYGAANGSLLRCSERLQDVSAASAEVLGALCSNCCTASFHQGAVMTMQKTAHRLHRSFILDAHRRSFQMINCTLCCPDYNQLRQMGTAWRSLVRLFTADKRYAFLFWGYTTENVLFCHIPNSIKILWYF